MGGKWWKCRNCAFFNQKHHSFCGWCRDSFQVLNQSPSTKDAPLSSQDYSVPSGKGKGRAYASGGQSSGKGNGKGGNSSTTKPQPTQQPMPNVWQRRAAAARAAPPMSVDQDGAADFVEADSDATAVLEQMQTTQALINSLKGRTDPLSTSKRQSLEAELRALRIQKTRLKPREEQHNVLMALVERKEQAVAATSQALAAAQAAATEAKEALADAKEQLARVDAQVGQEDCCSSFMMNGINPLEQAHSLAALLPQSKVDTFMECLSLLNNLVGATDKDGAFGCGSSCAAQPVSPLAVADGHHQQAPSTPIVPIQSSRGPAHLAPQARFDPYGMTSPSPSPARRRGRAASADACGAIEEVNLLGGPFLGERCHFSRGAGIGLVPG